MVAPEKVTWTAIGWTDEADTVLAELVECERDRILAGVADGSLSLYEITGARYAGFILFEFLKTQWGVVCKVIAFAGRNTAEGLKDLALMAKNAGAKYLTCSTTQAGVVRLYKKQGWEVEEFFLRLEL